jgi:HPt (histidine-containing phosphotransfer) domain-containing protein
MPEHSPPSDESIVVRIDPELADLIPRFLDHQRASLEVIQTGLATDQFSTIERIGHTMKGDGGGYGFDFISTVGAALEQAARTRSVEGVQACMDQLRYYLSRVTIVSS